MSSWQKHHQSTEKTAEFSQKFHNSPHVFRAKRWAFYCLDLPSVISWRPSFWPSWTPGVFSCEKCGESTVFMEKCGENPPPNWAFWLTPRGLLGPWHCHSGLLGNHGSSHVPRGPVSSCPENSTTALSCGRIEGSWKNWMMDMSHVYDSYVFTNGQVQR